MNYGCLILERFLRFGFEYPEEDWRSLKGDLGALSYDVTFWLAALIDRQSANCFVELYIVISLL